MIVAAAALVMACGGNSDKKLTPENKMVDLLNRMIEAQENVIKINEEAKEYIESLSPEDEKKAQAAAEQWIEDNKDRIEEVNKKMGEIL